MKNKEASKAIGIFDSGVGGLTVFAAVRRHLPNESLVYLGDTARVPYGIRSAETILRYSMECCGFLAGQNVKAIVVACNTASAYALQELTQKFDLPIIGVVGSGVRAALDGKSNASIGVIGTAATVASGIYGRMIRAESPASRVTEVACPLFVPLVEEGWLEGEVTEAVIQKHCAPFVEAPVDRLILGCTHYPLLKEALQKVLGHGVRLVDSAEEVAKDLLFLLQEKRLLADSQIKSENKIFVTDLPQKFQQVATLFLNSQLPPIEKVSVQW